MMNNQPTGNAVKKAKKSLFKAQMRTVIILLAAVIVLGVVCGAVMHVLRTDIDTYYETGHDGAGGTVTHTYYSRVNPSGGYMLVNEDGTSVASFKYGESICYETKLGTWLTLTGSGMISIYAQVEGDIMIDSENGGDTSSKSGVRTLLFQYSGNYFRTLLNSFSNIPHQYILVFISRFPEELPPGVISLKHTE